MARRVAASRIKSKEFCENHDCDNLAVTTCKYCNRELCKFHSDPVIVTNLHFIESIDRSMDYEKWKKYNDDWQRKDGHPCVEYTEWWNKRHAEKLALPLIKFPPRKSSPVIIDPTVISTAHLNKNHKTLLKVIVALIILAMVGVAVAYSSTHDVFSNLAGSLSAFLKNVSNNQTTNYPILSDYQLTKIATCVNLDLRIRVADYLNNSEIQQDINYCQYYNYNPPNDNQNPRDSNTALCSYIKSCISMYG